MPTELSGKMIEGVWQALRLYDHLSIREVAKLCNVSPSTVRRVLDGRHPGSKTWDRPRERRKPNLPLSQEYVFVVLGFHSQGMKISDIRKRTGVGRTTIHRILKGTHRHSPVE